jgi:hypothetical protein
MNLKEAVKNWELFQTYFLLHFQNLKHLSLLSVFISNTNWICWNQSIFIPVIKAATWYLSFKNCPERVWKITILRVFCGILSFFKNPAIWHFAYVFKVYDCYLIWDVRVQTNIQCSSIKKSIFCIQICRL